MSHCTKFDFSYSDEEAIVRAFRKMGVQTSYELIAEYNSDFQKKILSKFGHMGVRQMRAICGCKNGINMFMCKVAENKFELMCEHPKITHQVQDRMNKLGVEFQQAYIEVAVDAVVKKIENSGTPAQVMKQEHKYTINFGPSLEYQVVSEDGPQNEKVYEVECLVDDISKRRYDDLGNYNGQSLEEYYEYLKTSKKNLHIIYMLSESKYF